MPNVYTELVNNFLYRVVTECTLTKQDTLLLGVFDNYGLEERIQRVSEYFTTDSVYS